MPVFVRTANITQTDHWQVREGAQEVEEVAKKSEKGAKS
jgi:hypothetical protein